MPASSAPATTTTYDEVPYPSGAFEQTHPRRLATIASLFGLRSPEIGACRVLELGCASGGNLLPMAMALPGASFLGVDLSARQIAEGRRWVERLGLRNLRLEHRDILDLGGLGLAPGSFDYLIAHGVFYRRGARRGPGARPGQRGSPRDGYPRRGRAIRALRLRDLPRRVFVGAGGRAGEDPLDLPGAARARGGGVHQLQHAGVPQSASLRGAWWG
jgi:hypothetical protein